MEFEKYDIDGVQDYLDSILNNYINEDGITVNPDEIDLEDDELDEEESEDDD